jgi:TIR domain
MKDHRCPTLVRNPAPPVSFIAGRHGGELTSDKPAFSLALGHKGCGRITSHNHMAYVPDFKHDVFISYSHADDAGWIERLKAELESALIRKLRASTKPSIFFDTVELRAGRVFDADIPDALEATVFFLAMVSTRYNSSTYCRHKELTRFLRCNPAESGRTIQAHLDPSAALPLPQSLAVSFASGKDLLKAGSDEFRECLRRVYEPIVYELDKLYARSKMIFLAWPATAELQKERERLQAEIEGRGLRLFPEAIGEYESDIRFRDAFHESAASIHFFGPEEDHFAEQQFDLAVQVGKPAIVASRNQAEVRRGPAGSPPPIFLDQGNPTIAIANALDGALGRVRREQRASAGGLGKTGLYLVFKPDIDHTLGLRLRQRIINRGPFEILEPRPDLGNASRYEELSRARAALLCLGKAGNEWLSEELDALNSATVLGKFYDLRRAIYLKSASVTDNVELIEGDRILQSDNELDTFLAELHPHAQGAAA